MVVVGHSDFVVGCMMVVGCGGFVVDCVVVVGGANIGVDRVVVVGQRGFGFDNTLVVDGVDPAGLGLNVHPETYLPERFAHEPRMGCSKDFLADLEEC